MLRDVRSEIQEKMQPGIHMTKVWFDDDVIELKIAVSDGISFFSNKVYVGYQALDEMVSDLDVFREQIHGGLLVRATQ